MATAGVETSAPDATKLAALRNLTPEQMDKRLGTKMLMRPAWDKSWFTFQDQDSTVAHISKFPDWVQGLMIGWVKVEFAMFHRIWKSWNPEQLQKVITSAISIQV